MHSDGYFDQEIAARYDDSAREMFSQDMVEPVVDFLLERSGGGRALEFGIGTGRIALPLARRGIEVSGVDVSGPMLDELAKKPDGDTIDVVLGGLRHHAFPGVLLDRLRGLQHDRESDHTGRTGGVFPQRGGASRTQR